MIGFLMLFAVVVIAGSATAAARNDELDRGEPRASVVINRVARGLGGPPAWVSLATFAVIVWGIATALIFAPLGVLYTIVGLDSGRLSMTLSGLLIAGVAIHGFALGAAMIGSGRSMMARDGETLRPLARRMLAHHVAVLLALVPAGVEAVGLALLPCALGGLLALAVSASGIRPGSGERPRLFARAASAGSRCRRPRPSTP